MDLGPGLGPILFGLVYLLFLGGSLAIVILALIALWRIAAAHQALAQSVKELVDKLAVPVESAVSGREPEAAGSNRSQAGE